MTNPYPFGKPLNRPTETGPGLTPIEGRPNWFRTPDGAEKYVEPPPQPAQPVVLPRAVLYFHKAMGLF